MDFIFDGDVFIAEEPSVLGIGNRDMHLLVAELKNKVTERL